MQKLWSIQTPNPSVQASLSDALDIHPIVSQLLINRNILEEKSAKQFLDADLTGLHDPFDLKDMQKAVARINEAKKRHEKILVFGDYDVDGVTSSAILTRVLKELGLEVYNHIPHRMKDGYGLNHEIADEARTLGVDLLITVDCGITAKDEVDTINALGIDVIIIDHHETTEDHIPDAYAIVNPKQFDCPYPFKELATVGLVGKVTQALLGRVPHEYLDLIALGSIADIVPLVDENRIFAKSGLMKMAKTKNPGLDALMEIAKVNRSKPLSPFHVGFVLGPRINATGRMDSAQKSLDLFLSDEPDEARDIAKELDKFNVQRQKMQREVIDEAMEIVEQEVNFKDEKVIVLSKEGWHKGVLGIVASRLSDKYYRPAVVISVDDGVGTASCRSINGFHLHDALSDCSTCLEEFGGHEGAAGLTIKEENIDPFRNMINKFADDALEIKKLKPELSIDCEISLKNIDLKLTEVVSSLGPYGEGNPPPVFCSRNLTVKSYPAIMGKETLKFWVTDGENSISAVGFGMAKFSGMISPGTKVDLAFELSIDDWNKAPTPQFILKDIKLSE